MSLITNKGKSVKRDLKLDLDSLRGKEIAADLVAHFNEFHALDEVVDNEIELAYLEDELHSITNPKSLNFKRGLVTFSPSSASKCERELFYKAKKEQRDEAPFLPYQRRWCRNGSAVHAATQKDLLYAEKKLENPRFKVVRMKAPASVVGRPAWEHNLKNVKQFTDRGFQIFGMMDGVLEYKDGSKVGFEFKTKSTTIAAVGDFKLRKPQEGHVEQVTAYSILFGLEDFLLLYESVAKDGWMKGAEARSDLKAFHVKVTEEQKDTLLSKFDRVTKAVKDNIAPAPELNKCIFCPYKTLCEAERNDCE